MQDQAWEHIRNCIVKLRDRDTGESGTGFLVGPGLILTARHVVPSGSATVFWNGVERKADSLPLSLPRTADAALLSVDLSGHPIVKLGNPPAIREPLRLAGYSFRGGVQHEEAVTAELEDDQFQHPAELDGTRLLKFKGGQTVGGLSGSPLIRELTMEVAGIVSDSRDQGSDLGGLAVPVQFLLEYVPDLRNAQLETLWDETPWCPASLQRDGVLHLYLGHYLAANEPFFGRDADLEALTTWFEDSAAPPYALLTAQAGSGKSSLLVHWFNVLCQRRDVRSGLLDVIFLPITIRFDFCREADVIRRLTLRLTSGLLRLHAEAERANGVRELREVLTRALTTPGKRRLLILDGIDEASGWEVGATLLPTDLAAHTKVVVAGRELATRDHFGWRAHLGWSAPASACGFQIGNLRRPQVVEAAKAWWALANPESIGERLYDLTQGDPLVLGLYLSSSQRSNPPTSFPAAAPGIEGFFKGWWEDQEKQWGKKRGEALGRIGKTLLNVLAGAFEPVGRADLLQIVKLLTDCDGDALNDSLETLQRFVVGTPSLALSHPRLATSRWKALVDDREHTPVEEAFLTWSERATVSPYCVRCFRKHLERADAPAVRWRRLASRGWRDAWETEDDWRDGYIEDIQSAGERFAAGDREAVERGVIPPFLLSECEVAWRRGLVDVFEKRITPHFARELVRHGLWRAERAFEQIRATQRGDRAIDGFAMLAPWLGAQLLPRVMAAISGLPTSSFDSPRSISVSALVRRSVEIGESKLLRPWIATLPEASGVAGCFAYGEATDGTERRDALAAGLKLLSSVYPYDTRAVLLTWLLKSFTAEEVWAALRLTNSVDIDSLRLALGLATKRGAPLDALSVRVLWPWLSPKDRAAGLQSCFEWIRYLLAEVTAIQWVSEVGPIVEVCSQADAQTIWDLLHPTLLAGGTFLAEGFTVAFSLRSLITDAQGAELDALIPMAVDTACKQGHHPTAVGLAKAMAVEGLAGQMTDTLITHASNRWTAPDILQVIAPYLNTAQINRELERLDLWRAEDRDSICGSLLAALAVETLDSARSAFDRAGKVLGTELICLNAMLGFYAAGPEVPRARILDYLRCEPDNGIRKQLIMLLGPRLGPWDMKEVREVLGGMERQGELVTALMPHIDEHDLDSGRVHELWNDDSWPDFEGETLVNLIRQMGSRRGVTVARDWTIHGERRTGHFTWRLAAATALGDLADEAELELMKSALQRCSNEHIRVAGLAALLEYLPKDEQSKVWQFILEYLGHAHPPSRGRVAAVLERLPPEYRPEAIRAADIDAMFKERGSLSVWVGEYAAVMPWASKQAIDQLLEDTNRLSRLDSGSDRETLRAAVAPRLLDLHSDAAAFDFARQIGGADAWYSPVAMLKFIRTAEQAKRFAEACAAGRLLSTIALARELASPGATQGSEIKIALVSAILASVRSQQDAVLTLAALCPVIAEMAGVSVLPTLASMIG